MDNDNPKKFNVLENILQKVNQKYIALPEHERKRNNKLIEVINRIIQTLSNKSILFKNLYKEIFYGGSFYDGLKVGSPTEYDLDCLLILPKIAEPTVEVSNKPGFVHVVLKNMKALKEHVTEGPKYVGLEKLMTGNRLCAKKVRSWMEGLITSALNKTKEFKIKIDDGKDYVVKHAMTKSGPAYTFKLISDCDGEKFNLDIDLVPCFRFSDEQWPQPGYRPNISKTRNTFFVVPKNPDEQSTQYWRLSFQEQERDWLSGCEVMKPSIRLIKKIRDRYKDDCIASYYIKTIFLWELEKNDKNFFCNKSLSFVFIVMLKKYAEYIEQKHIPYYWNDNCNLLANVSGVTLSSIANKINRFLKKVEAECDTPSDKLYELVLRCLLSKDEFDLETFMQEVPLTKRQLKNSPAIAPPAVPSTPVIDTTQFTSSRSSSFEEITKAMLEEPTTVVQESSVVLSKLETLIFTVTSGQDRICQMLQSAVNKIETCERQIEELKAEMNRNKHQEVEHNQEILRRINDIDSKIYKAGEIQK